MGIVVGGFDVHRAQITFDYTDSATGEVVRGKIGGTRLELREWLSRFDGHDDVSFAFEGCTGWRYVAEELEGAGICGYMAEPADTATLRGKKKRAKTDRADALLLRRLLSDGRLPLSWIPPAHVIEVRVLARMYQRMLSDRREWIQRIHAQLFQQGCESVTGLTTEPGRRHLMEVALSLSPAGHRLVDESVGIIDELTGRIEQLRCDLGAIGRSQPGCAELQKLWGIGPLLAPIIWAEMGDTRRFSSSSQAVRYTGLDITVHDSDNNRMPGKLSRQGSSTLRWALVEAAQHASKKSSPDHVYYQNVRQRVGASRAALSVARKHARRIHHMLANLGDTAWETT
jgi:transposase